jgi:DNA-binding NtrC family response regulator
MARHFLRRHAVELGVEGAAIRPEALALLEQHSWPGNVRELENVMRQVLLRSQPFAVSADHIASALAAAGNRGAATGPMLASFVSQLLDQAEAGTGTGAYWRMIEELEPELFAQAIKRAQGNQAKAARWLGVTRLKMREKLIELGLHPASAGSGAEPNSEAGPAS